MRLVFAAIVALAAAGPVLAQPPSDSQSMPNMSAAQGAGQSSMIMANGVGVVAAVDIKAGTVTIHHSPIAKLNWPAMTMAFEATPPSLLQGVKVGESVTFQLMQMGSSTTLTAIQPK